MAVRPKTLTAAVAPVIVATALVKAEHFPVIWWISFCALLSAVFIQIGTNFVNDAIDFKKGADTETRTGPRRVTQSGLLTHRQVMGAAFFCFFVAFLLGIPLVAQGGWPIVAIGLVSIALGYGYTGGPFPLAYKGLGDLFVILFFGLVAIAGVFYLQTGELRWSCMVAGLQIGFLTTVLIAINNLRDAPEDEKVGKKTLAVRFGLNFARVEIAFLAVTPVFLGVFWYRTGVFDAAILPMMCVPIVRRILAGVFKTAPGAAYNTFLGMAALLQMLFGATLAAGLWWP
jgi:1,4-dihydroxy-2-naphthoate octaprenyltransferase